MTEFSTYKDSPEKQWVREQCWLPLLANRKNSKKKRISYLTLPGRRLTEIEMLANDGVIEGMHDLYLCERSKLDYYMICRDVPRLKYHMPAEIPTIALGEIQELIVDGQLDRYFPFDAINLDFVGGAWGNDRSQTSTKMAAIQKIIRLQGDARHPFTLFVTVSSKSGGQNVLEEVLAEHDSLLDEEQKREVTTLPHHGKVLVVFPIILAHWAVDAALKIRCTHRYTYIGEGLSTRMLKFAFEFEPFEIPTYGSVTAQKSVYERQCIREMLSQSTIELEYDAESGEVKSGTYNPAKQPAIEVVATLESIPNERVIIN